MLLRETEDFFNFGIHSTATVTSEMYFLSRITIKTNKTHEIMVHTTNIFITNFISNHQIQFNYNVQFVLILN